MINIVAYQSGPIGAAGNHIFIYRARAIGKILVHAKDPRMPGILDPRIIRS